MKRWLCGWVGSVDGGFVWWCFLWRMVVLCGGDFCGRWWFCDGGTEGIGGIVGGPKTPQGRCHSYNICFCIVL